MILQLDPSILVETPLGRGQTLFIIDYGMHQNTCWVVALQDSGIIKHFDCNDIILSTNYTYGLNLRHNTNNRQDEQPDETTGDSSKNASK
ncbi:MAG: hypothetical protein JWQ38_830 [Flavipsychrobacter sp.]|nr:hypothetical protein [Flavipsychrobacter sp.]